MGFAWVFSLILIAWVFFVLGKKYQDMSDILMARRVAKLIEQRKAVNVDQTIWQEAEEQARRTIKTKEAQPE
jgi:hypothetical protein